MTSIYFPSCYQTFLISAVFLSTLLAQEDKITAITSPLLTNNVQKAFCFRYDGSNEPISCCLMQKNEKICIEPDTNLTASSSRQCYRAQHMDKQKVKAETNFCYANIVVVGIGKCGTSALYKALSSHDQIAPPSKNGRLHGKEHCPSKPPSRLNPQNLFKFLESFDNGQPLAQTTTADSRKQRPLTINGCILPDRMGLIDALLPGSRTLYLFAVRHLADFLWSAYNFWCSPQLGDARCRPGGWAAHTPGGALRSPERFHALSLRNASASPRPVFPYTFGWPSPAGGGERAYFSSQLALLPGGRALVVAKEAFEADPVAQWGRVVAFVGERLGVELGPHPSIEYYHTHHVNDGNRPGQDSIMGENQVNLHPPGTYAVSDYRPMLRDTYDLIAGRWQECPEIARASGYAYNCSIPS